MFRQSIDQVRDARPRLIIICGLPGSGKTTLAKELETRLKAVRLSADDWMDALSINLHFEEARAKIEALQWNLAQRLLTLNLKVIIEWGTWLTSERDALRERARSLGADVELHYLAVSPQLLFERVQRRNREIPAIAQNEMSKWLEVFQSPTPEELALYDSPILGIQNT